MTRWLFRNGVRRGLLGGSRPWTIIAVLTGSLRLFNRFRGKEPEIAYREVLDPGQTLVIHVEREPGQGSVEILGAPPSPS